MRKSLLSLIIPLVLISGPVRGDDFPDPEKRDPNIIYTFCTVKNECAPWGLRSDRYSKLKEEVVLSQAYRSDGLLCCDYVYPLGE